ncbi:hypothetical protein Spb1_00400 [Planctopirus ephydatiae]|uniref:Uncharacterized protein n=1 Tax=Planctopirus ephydatiae TaxID=2528019 RepID=A0A518GHW0_9PLAN|nr:hypothetical protein [Planctopirus ephydatiae]QDV28177.1 hypothetical protein Spb1_00400 [Planctopirus ephydatiae]
MPSLLRGLLAIGAGILSIIVIVSAGEAIGHLVYPPPAQLDFNDPAQLQKFIATLPAGAFLFVQLAWMAGCFTGSLVASWIQSSRLQLMTFLMTAFVLLAAIANLYLLPHPTWFAISSLTGILVTGGATAWLLPGILPVGKPSENSSTTCAKSASDDQVADR